MIITTVLAGVEQAVNGFLALDQEVANEIFALQGNVLKIQLTDLNIAVFVVIRADRLGLSAHFDGEVDGAILGSSLVLLKSVTQGVSIGSGVSIEGDVTFVERFSSLMRKFRIDWEELLSKVLGDIAANKVHTTLTGALNWGSDALQRVQLDVNEYVHEEARVTPPRLELEAFYQSVAGLRDGVERIEARINRLQHVEGEG